MKTGFLSMFAHGLMVVGLGTASFACGSTVNFDEDDLENEGEGASSDDPLVATSAEHTPSGLWTMAIQYGAVGEQVSPTIPLQVEFREDGTAYRWVCAGAPSDGNYGEACPPASRTECMVGSIAWDGAAWRFEFPTLEEQFTVEEMGDVTPDGDGRLLLSYINPTYSGALFERIASADDAGDACVP